MKHPKPACLQETASIHPESFCTQIDSRAAWPPARGYLTVGYNFIAVLGLPDLPPDPTVNTLYEQIKAMPSLSYMADFIILTQA